jgi:hypothetical protein
MTVMIIRGRKVLYFCFETTLGFEKFEVLFSALPLTVLVGVPAKLQCSYFPKL